MSTGRPQTPSPVKRVLRQEAAFGCCVCGHPIIEYHHIVPYSEEPHFRPADMMVLCPNHHDEATYGALSKDRIRQRTYKDSPYNILEGRANGYLEFPSPLHGLSIGRTDMGVGFPKPGPILLVDRECVLRIDPDEDRRVLVSAILRDEHDTVLASVTRNEWRSEGPEVWDIEFKYQWLKMRTKANSISLEMDVANGWVYIEGRLWRSGICLELRKDGLYVNGGGISGLSLDGGLVDINSKTGARALSSVQHNPPVAWLGPKLGRNVPCWCRSTTKFKQCHGL